MKEKKKPAGKMSLQEQLAMRKPLKKVKNVSKNEVEPVKEKKKPAGKMSLQEQLAMRKPLKKAVKKPKNVSKNEVEPMKKKTAREKLREILESDDDDDESSSWED